MKELKTYEISKTLFLQYVLYRILGFWPIIVFFYIFFNLVYSLLSQESLSILFWSGQDHIVDIEDLDPETRRWIDTAVRASEGDPKIRVKTITMEQYIRLCQMRDRILRNRDLKKKVEMLHKHSLYDEPNTTYDHLHPDWKWPNVLTDPTIGDYPYDVPDEEEFYPLGSSLGMVAIIIFFSFDIFLGWYNKRSVSVPQDINLEDQKMNKDIMDELNSTKNTEEEGSDKEQTFFDL